MLGAMLRFAPIHRKPLLQKTLAPIHLLWLFQFSELPLLFSPYFLHTNAAAKLYRLICFMNKYA
jgi:hypothetical protein